MAQNKCPLCGGKIQNGECVSCGFAVRDEEVIAAPYNYDPSDYNIGAEKQRAAVLEKERLAMPDIKVADSRKVEMDDVYSGAGVANGSGAANVRDGQYNALGNAQANQQQGNPYANRQQGSPYANQQQGNPYANRQQGNPYANRQQGNPYANQQNNNGSPYAGPYVNNNPPSPYAGNRAGQGGNPYANRQPQNNPNPYANNRPQQNNGNPYANANIPANWGANKNQKFGGNNFGNNNTNSYKGEMILAIILTMFSPFFGVVFTASFIKRIMKTQDAGILKALVPLIIVTLLRLLISAI